MSRISTANWSVNGVCIPLVSIRQYYTRARPLHSTIQFHGEFRLRINVELKMSHAGNGRQTHPTVHGVCVCLISWPRPGQHWNFPKWNYQNSPPMLPLIFRTFSAFGEIFYLSNTLANLNQFVIILSCRHFFPFRLVVLRARIRLLCLPFSVRTRPWCLLLC